MTSLSWRRPTSRTGLTVERRDVARGGIGLGSQQVVGILLGAGLSLVVVMVLGGGLEGVHAIWTGTFSSSFSASQVIELATALIIAGTAAALAQRAQMWNLGVQAQLIGGAWLATAVAFALPHLPSAVLIPSLILAGLIGGAVAMVIPALARAFLNVSEVITTLMFSFIGELWFLYWASGPWGAESATTAIYSRPITPEAYLPEVSFAGVDFGIGFFVAIAVALVVGGLLRYTRYGHHVAMLGAGDKTAAYAGLQPRRLRFEILLLSGAIGGLAGAIPELGETHSFSSPLVEGSIGFIGIVVALLAINSPALTIVTGLVMATLAAAGPALQVTGTSTNIVFLLTGLMLVGSASGAVVMKYRLRWHGSGGARSSVDERLLEDGEAPETR